MKFGCCMIALISSNQKILASAHQPEFTYAKPTIEINAAMMELDRQNKKHSLKIAANPDDANSQEVRLTAGTPVIVLQSCIGSCKWQYAQSHASCQRNSIKHQRLEYGRCSWNYHRNISRVFLRKLLYNTSLNVKGRHSVNNTQFTSGTEWVIGWSIRPSIQLLVDLKMLLL